MSALTVTDLPLPLIARGKVRDIYSIPASEIDIPAIGGAVDLVQGEEALLFVATDRVSAFDVIMKNGIAQKGSLLTQLSTHFFDYLAVHPNTSHIPNHVLTSDVSKMPKCIAPFVEQLHGRTLMVKKCEILPVEAIVRGYITGSAWKEYKETGTVHGVKAHEDLLESAKYEPAIFTPSTKAEVGGKDINVSFDELPKYLLNSSEAVVLSNLIKEYALALYTTAADYAHAKGIILADTKFEFGLWLGHPVDRATYPDENTSEALEARFGKYATRPLFSLDPQGPNAGRKGILMFVDECLTPDSSRYWDARDWAPGKTMVGFDKQFLREWLKAGGGGFDTKSAAEGVIIPDDVAAGTWGKYTEIYQRLTGKAF